MRPEEFDDHGFGQLFARLVGEPAGNEVAASSKEWRQVNRLDAEITRYSNLTSA